MNHEPSAEKLAKLAAESKERIYITFTSLAVVLALRGHAEDMTPGLAGITLAITVFGTLLAVFLADVMSHLAVHATLPTGAQLRYMVGVSLGSLSVIGLPMVFLWLADLDLWSTATALRASSLALVASLVVVSYLPIRQAKLPLLVKSAILFGEFVLGLVILGIELLVHG
jgi:hypothetical protein